MQIKALATLLLLPLVLTQGCILPKQYRPVDKLTPLVVPPTPDGTVPSSIAQSDTALPIGQLCTDSVLKPSEGPEDEKHHPCIAFIEYDKNGKRYDLRQVQRAVDLVTTAIAADPQHQPVIVGFVHGWKHNASPGNGQPGQISTNPPEDANIQGFEHVLNFLYRCAYAGPQPNNPCQQQKQSFHISRGPLSESHIPTEGHVVVGIYFGWYAANISPFWPVAQQLSVYSRGNEADTVGCTTPNDPRCLKNISDDLQTISHAAHPAPRSDKEPLFILAGHSYGARLLEQAVTQPLEQRITRQLNSPDHSVPNFADLILYINSAAPAWYGIDMFNFLGKNCVRYHKTLGDQREEPLLASITTPADGATGVLFTIANSPRGLVHSGSTALTCFDSASGATFPATEDTPKLYRNTLAHMQEFQSHTFNDQGKLTSCVDSKPGSFGYSVRDHCYFVEPAPPMPKYPHRWNGTPYWIISTDQHVIPDHGTIFTNRLLNLIGAILPDDKDKAIVTR